MRLPSIVPVAASAWLLLLFCNHAVSQTPPPGGIPVTNYQCFDCVKDENGNPRKVRAMFMDSASVVENPAARERAVELGVEYDCNDPAKALPECFVAENWNSGWVGALSKQIFDNLGVEVIAMTQANFTLNSSAVYSGGSSYTRCVWEIRVGGADICVGDFWETNERRRIAPFTSSFDLDKMRLVSMPGGEEGFKFNSLLNIFIPLEDTVWAVTAAMFFFTAFLMWFVEQGVGAEDFEYEDSLSSEVFRQIQGCCKSLWLTLLGMVSAAPSHTPTTWPGRLIVLGYAFMLYITAASYTANLASTLITPSVVEGKISSLQDLGRRGRNLCLLEAMNTLIDPAIVPPEQLVGFGWYGPMLEQLYRGKCDGAIIGKTEYQTHVLGQAVEFTACTHPDDPLNHGTCQDPSIEPELIDLPCSAGCKDAPDMDRADCPESCPHYRKYCEMLEVVAAAPEPAFDLAIGMGMPVSNELQDYVSAWIVPLLLGRTVSRLRTQFVDEAAPDVCSVQGESEALDVEAMAGTFFFSAIIMFIGLVFFVFEKLLGSGKAPASKKSGSATDDAAEGADDEKADRVPGKGEVPVYENRGEKGTGEGPPAHQYEDEDESAKNIINTLSAKIDVMMKRLEQLEEQDVPVSDAKANGNGAARKPSIENGPNGTESKEGKEGFLGGIFGI